MKTIEVGMFARVQDNEFHKHGVRKGDVVYVAGDSVVAVEEEDPYMLRRIFVAAYTDKGHVLSEKKPFMIDGMRLKPVGKALQERYQAYMEEDFGAKEEVDGELEAH